MARKRSVRTGRRLRKQEPVAAPEDLESVSPPEDARGGARRAPAEELPPFDPSQAVPAEDLAYDEREGRGRRRGGGAP